MFRSLIAIASLVSLTQAAPQIFDVPRVVGGEATFIEDHPYQALLQYLLQIRCGAVVISEDYVLTAAHCTYGLTVDRLSVRAGSTYRNRGGIIVRVAAIHQHPNYNSSIIDYDISVLRLASSLSFGSTIAPVVLPQLNQEVVAGSIGQITGWGLLQESTPPPPTQLQVVEVPLISLEQCKREYEGNYTVTERMVCAGYPEGLKDACTGDSGGPLVVNGTLIGLVSWGEGCARPKTPGVYASVPVLRGYITEVTGI